MNSLYRDWRRWLLIFGGWTLFGFFFACQNIIYDAYFGRPMALGRTLISWLSCAYLWALLTPFVVGLAERSPLERKTIWRNMLVHLAISVLLSLFQLTMYVFVRQLLPGGLSETLSSWQSFQYLLISTSHENLLIYWALLGLAHATNYYRRFRERERRAAQLELESAQLETQLTRTQLDALKMQLHPHFLFNTLNSISVLMQEDVKAANQMLVRLSDLLRLALKNTDAQEVSLKQVLFFMSSYLEIEQKRFHDRLQV
jgi:sensor histidine kinase YesM